MSELHPVDRRLLTLTLEELRAIEDHLGQLDQTCSRHITTPQRLAEVPGLGVDSAQQIIAEVGAAAATFPSAKHLASWMGACPGNEESAGVNYSHRCPKGNRQMRRVLNQAANAAVKAKGTIFAVVYRRIVPRLGHAQGLIRFSGHLSGGDTHVQTDGRHTQAATQRRQFTTSPGPTSSAWS